MSPCSASTFPTCPSPAAVCQAASPSQRQLSVGSGLLSLSLLSLPLLLAPTSLVIPRGSLNPAHTSLQGFQSPSTTGFSKSQLSWPLFPVGALTENEETGCQCAVKSCLWGPAIGTEDVWPGEEKTEGNRLVHLKKSEGPPADSFTWLQE